jgi:hypothetical protein
VFARAEFFPEDVTSKEMIAGNPTTFDTDNSVRNSELARELVNAQKGKFRLARAMSLQSAASFFFSCSMHFDSKYSCRRNYSTSRREFQASYSLATCAGQFSVRQT